jgi:hypothetical protein
VTWLPWILVAALAAIVGWLLLALHGADRTIAELRGAAAEDVVHVSSGLAAGSRAPTFEAWAATGGRFDASELSGLRHLMLFADPACVSCVELVPEVLTAAARRALPLVVVVSQGSFGDQPEAWRRTDRSRLVIEEGTSVTDAFEVDVTPTAFVIDEGGWVVAGGPVRSVGEVIDLARDAEGVRIVGEAPVDG